MSSTTGKSRPLSVPRKDESSRLWLSLCSTAAECRQLLAFLGVPGSSPLLQQMSALSMDSGQTTWMPRILRLLVEAYLIFCKPLHPLLKQREFVSEQAAWPITPTASALGTPGPQLLQNYPTATLQLPTSLSHPLYPRRKQSHSPPRPRL